MTLNGKTLGASGLVLALALSAGFTARAEACGGSKTSKATTTAAADGAAKTDGACGSSMTTASSGACGAKATQTAGACGAKGMQTAGGCGAHKGSAMQTAEVTLPEGTQMTRVDVKGGIDLVFTGKDLAGVENFLNANMESCTQAAKAGKKAKQTCTVARTDENVTLSIRGKDAEACCESWLQTAALTDEAKAEDEKTSKKI